MSRRLLYAAALVALATSACASADQGSPAAPESATASSTSSTASSTTSETETPTSTTVSVPPGPVAEILAARQVSPDDFHDMSYGGETPESMTKSRMVAFRTPSANIACTWDPGAETGETAVTCSAKDRTSPPPVRPADCENNWATSYVQLGPDGSVDNGVCTGGVLVPSIANTLPYGSALVAGDFGCLSAETGVTCAHIPSGRGFVLSREQLAPF